MKKREIIFIVVLAIAAILCAQPKKPPKASWLKLSDREIIDSMKTYGLYGTEQKADLKELQSMAKTRSFQEMEQHYKDYEAYFKKIECLSLSSPFPYYSSKINLKKIDALKANGFDPLRIRIKMNSSGWSEEESSKAWDDAEVMYETVILLAKYTKRIPLKNGYHRREYVVTEVLRDYSGIYKIGMFFSNDFYWDEEAEVANARSIGMKISVKDLGTVGKYTLIYPIPNTKKGEKNYREEHIIDNKKGGIIDFDYYKKRLRLFDEINDTKNFYKIKFK